MYIYLCREQTGWKEPAGQRGDRPSGRASFGDHAGHPRPPLRKFVNAFQVSHLIDHCIGQFRFNQCLKVGMGVSCVVPKAGEARQSNKF